MLRRAVPFRICAVINPSGLHGGLAKFGEAGTGLVGEEASSE
jgi:hypothetical protein